MKDKISQLIYRRKALGAEIEIMSTFNTPKAVALVVSLKRRYKVLDKKIANLWE